MFCFSFSGWVSNHCNHYFCLIYFHISESLTINCHNQCHKMKLCVLYYQHFVCYNMVVTCTFWVVFIEVDCKIMRDLWITPPKLNTILVQQSDSEMFSSGRLRVQTDYLHPKNYQHIFKAQFSPLHMHMCSHHSREVCIMHLYSPLVHY